MGMNISPLIRSPILAWSLDIIINTIILYYTHIPAVPLFPVFRFLAIPLD